MITKINTETPENYTWCGYTVLHLFDTEQIGDFRYSVLYDKDGMTVHTWTSGKDLRVKEEM